MPRPGGQTLITAIVQHRHGMPCPYANSSVLLIIYDYLNLMPPLISVIVLNWNGKQFLGSCLRALQAQTYPNFEVVLVENGSNDGSTEYLRQEFGAWDKLKLLELPQNTGFSGGNLAGLNHANPESRYIATLNNDTVADPRWLEELAFALENHSAEWAAACGPMTFANDPELIASAGIEIRRNGLALDRAIGEKLQTNQTEREIFGVCAGAALYRREAIEAVGFFDPAFFAYLEDADLAWRLRLSGWRSLYIPEAQVTHAYSGTGKQGSPFKSFQLGRNRVWVILKNTPTKLLLRNLPRILLYDIAASFYTLLFRRDIHPLRGRLAALLPHHLRRVWRQRREIQAQRKISTAYLKRWLSPDFSFRSNLELRQAVDHLALSHSETSQP